MHHYPRRRFRASCRTNDKEMVVEQSMDMVARLSEVMGQIQENLPGLLLPGNLRVYHFNHQKVSCCIVA